MINTTNDYNKTYASRQDDRESNARTYAKTFRFAIKSAQGMMITDVNNKTYYDCLSCAGALALGHNHPQVINALNTAIKDEVPFQTLDMMTPLKDKFIEALFSSLPAKFASRARIQFCSPCGTDAVEAAIKLTRIATQKSDILSFRGAYHGMGQGAMSMMGNRQHKQQLPNLIGNTQFLPYPYKYRCPFGVGGDLTSEISINYIRSLIEDQESGVIPAGIIAELVQGEGGVIPASDKWTQGIRQITLDHSIPLLIDEVQTGWGRTGRLYSFEHSKITPDVIILSKAIGGGLPLAVIIYDKDLDVWQTGAHMGTFRGNTLAMATGLETLEIIQQEKLLDNSVLMGERFRRHLSEIQKECFFFGDIRGRGLMLGVEIVDPKKGTDNLGHFLQSGELARKIKLGCFAKGLIMETGGRDGSVLRLLPPLNISPNQVDAICDILRDVCLQVKDLYHA
jgi:diaminobutyrate-2-oxoglutarate transaminase